MSEVNSIRQRAIAKLTRRYGKAFVRFTMNPKHTTNALIPVPVQDLAKAIQSATSVESLKRYEEAAEGILGGRIQPTDLRRVLAVERTGGSGGGPFRRRRSSRLASRSTSVPDPSADLATQLRVAKDQLTEANNKLTEALNELMEKDKELGDLKNVTDELEQVKEDLDLTKKDLEACEDRENNAGDASAREASLQTEISRLKTDLLNAKASLRTAQTDKQDSQREVNAKNVELRQKDDLIVSKDAEISSLNMKIISLNTEITELSELLGKCDREKRAEAEKIRKKTEEDLKKAEKAAEEKAAKERVARELAARQSMPPPAPKPADQAVERDGPDTMLDTADENDLSDLLGDNSTPEPVKVEAAKCTTLPTGFVSAAKVEDSVMTKDILEFAESVKLDPEKILVYSNRSNWFGSAQYCPIKSVEIIPPPQKSKVTVMKDGAEKTFTIGTQQLKKEDFYVLKEEFEAYLNPDFRDDDDSESDENLPQGLISNDENGNSISKVDSLSEVPMKEEVSEAEETKMSPDVVSDSEEDEWEDLPSMRDYQEYLNVGDIIRQKGQKKEYVIKKVLKSGVQAKGLIGNNEKVGTTRRLNIGWQKKKNSTMSPADKKSNDDDSGSEGSEKDKPASTSSPQESTPMKEDEWEVLPTLKDHKTMLKKGDIIKSTNKRAKREYVITDVSKSGFKAEGLGKKRQQIKNGKWKKKKRSLMARFEAFDGIDGLVPALPSIRIPERHEMM